MTEFKFVGCMVGSAIGDAGGSPFEGLPNNQLNIEDLKFHGSWTDDTHMMIGVAESLIANEGFNAEHMTWTFIRNWEQEPWRGYGPGPPKVFRMIRSGVPWSEAAKRLYRGMGSYGNGAAMRIAPISLFYHDDLKRLRTVSYASAEITHTHELGKEGAALQAYAVALAVKANPETFSPKDFLEKLKELALNETYRRKLERVQAILSGDDRNEVVRELGNSVEAYNSVPTAIYCFTKNHENYVKAVLHAVSLGGDSDTIAAMTGAIAGAYHGIENIPKAWQQKLEGHGSIQALARKLWKTRNATR